MNLTKTAGVLLAVLLVATAGVTALPGNAPADSEAEQYDDGANAGNTPADAGPQMHDSEMSDENASNAEDRRGPPTDMPEQVPDHVSQIHDLIHQFLDGDIDTLGEQISELMGENADGQETDDADEDDSEDADEDDSEQDEESEQADDEQSGADSEETADGGDDSDSEETAGDTQDSDDTEDGTTTATPTATPA